MEPRPPGLGAWRLSHWTPREVPRMAMIFFFFKKQVLVRMWGERGHLCSISGFVNYNSHYGKPHGGSSETCCSVTQLCPTLCDPMDCSPPGFPVHRRLPEFAQTHVRRVGDAFSKMTPHSSGNAKSGEFTPKAPRSRWPSAGVGQPLLTGSSERDLGL